MKAMILAAGLGKRLRPLTKDTPKPLLSVGQYTLIELVLNKLIKHGVDELIINVSYLSEQIKNKLEYLIFKLGQEMVAIELSHII